MVPVLRRYPAAGAGGHVPLGALAPTAQSETQPLSFARDCTELQSTNTFMLGRILADNVQILVFLSTRSCGTFVKGSLT